MQPFRLASGGCIDRSRPLRFTWDGRQLTGFAGDTLASALVANGVRLVGRSFKYHRPRGLVAAGVHEPNALVQLGDGARSTPNVRATEIELYDGLTASPVNCWPSVRFDIGAINDVFSRFLSAGFYYKTFMWPDWHLFEGVIRRAAGLGRAPDAADPDRYEHRFAHCDVLVIGAGPAGLAAARAASAGGGRVMIVEQDDRPGGTLLHGDATVDHRPGGAWAADTLSALSSTPDVTVLLRATAIGCHDDRLVSVVERVGNEVECAGTPGLPRSRLWLVRARRIILATGALERPLVFPGNDRPGVMLAEATRTYALRFAALAGRQAVVFTNNDDAYRTAHVLVDAGARVVALVDSRAEEPPAARCLRDRGVPVIIGGEIVASRGRKSLSAVCVRQGGRTDWLACDHLAMSGGHNPVLHLFSQAGGRLIWDAAQATFVPESPDEGLQVVGAAAGEWSTAGALAGGHAAGLKAAAATGHAASLAAPAVDGAAQAEGTLVPLWSVAAPGKAFVDFQNDVTTDDIALAARENFRSVEHLKRYTTLGMATDQGKTSNINALAIMGALTGREPQAVGQTRFRFPYTPVSLAAFGGRARGALLRPLRHMPAHDRHLAAGALLEDYGGWARPACYPGTGEDPAAAEQREALSVRTAAGMFEASPLGKIEVVGPDAARFLDLVYANTMSSLKPGRIRYGLMLGERGAVLDDGVAVRIAEDRFLICTSTAGADGVAAWLEEWLQCEWPDLQVVIVPVTPAWGVLTLTGPSARAIIQQAGTTLPVETMAHMTYAEGEVAGLPVRCLRVSYTGETSFELNVPARSTGRLWNCLMEAGTRHGLAPVGVEAWMILRTEKGYLHIGGDTDGATNAHDIGWSHVLKRPVDFVGKRSLLRDEDMRSDRLQFVGLDCAGTDHPPIGSHVICGAGAERCSDGYVTSAAFSPFLRRPVALAMIRGARARMGESVDIEGADGRRYTARIAKPAVYDPENARLA